MTPAVAEHRYSVDTALPVGTLWDFVREMDHWAPFLTGYQTHEKRSETESVWTLKGNTGVVSRTLTFRVLVTEWAGPDRVTFALEGVNEPMRGEGAFCMEAVAADAPGAPAPAAGPAGAPETGPSGRLARLWHRLVRALFRRLREPVRLRGEEPGRGPAAAAAARMTFHLRIEPGGPMAPMIDAMMKPAMEAAAEDLARRIVHHLESRDRAAS